MNKTIDREFVNSLAKGLKLLMCFKESQRVWNLTEMARENDMNLPTARRYLHTFTKMGFMIKDETTKTFQLTPKVLRLGAWVINSMGIKQRLLPYMKAIRNDLDVTTHCSILEGNEIVALKRIRSSNVLNLDLGTGSRLPLHATAMGKAIVAFMDIEEQKKIAEQLDFQPLTPKTITEKDSFLTELQKTRERGYAVTDQELTIGLKTMGIPIFNTKGIVEASFGVSYPLSRAQKEGFENVLINRLIDVKKNA